ncbi:hypothetical protein [Pseudanabaena yagii]|uniref:Uncharacterized protein n=1 Tax=Pseudanabaena yagii GIHE-NHR1 TaxID=2722753 RepID=A0ABX1M0D6_9CYAN|nr:hypothetical protein [Pseudanabaena yagii]NMF61116.1 hypothetical protein [Pseudanabaena yagii GIHE-NHR1]
MNENIDELTERMFATATIDDPVFARQLFLDMESSLPINVRINEIGFQALKEQGVYLADTNTVYEMDKVFYAGDMAGILCSMSAKDAEVSNSDQDDQDDQKSKPLVMSLTHLRIETSHPLAAKIREYQKIRSMRLAIANSGRTLKPVKSKKNKKGFGA